MSHRKTRHSSQPGPSRAHRSGSRTTRACREWTVLCELVVDVPAHITGVVWKIECAVGDQVAEGDVVVVLESMKMEMPVETEDAGTVREIRCAEGQAVHEGETLVVLE